MPHTSLLKNFAFGRAQLNFPNVQCISRSFHRPQGAVVLILISPNFTLPSSHTVCGRAYPPTAASECGALLRAGADLPN